MRKYLAAVVAVLALAGCHSTTTAHPHPKPVLESCSENWTGYVSPSIANASVVWNTNSCGWQIRVKIRCYNPATKTLADYYGGWVIPVGLFSGKTCPSTVPELLNAYAQYRVASGFPITTVKFY